MRIGLKANTNNAVPSSGGTPLSPSVRAEMEPHFRRDFSDVRIHTDAAAARSAHVLDARAYTVGRDIAFASNEYRPASEAGLRLIAHELAHVVQQHGVPAVPQAQLVTSTPGDSSEHQADAAADAVVAGRPAPSLSPVGPMIQRTCGKALGPPAPDCTPSTAGVGGWPFMFKVNCDELLAGEEANLSHLKKGATVEIHGFASIEGPGPFNLELSCHRANKVAELIRTKRPDVVIRDTFKHGASPGSGPGIVPDPHPRAFWRTVYVTTDQPERPELQGQDACGPDVTDWLIDQIGVAKRNAKVREVKKQLDLAAYFAPLISTSSSLVFNSTEILQGVVATKVGQAWDAAGKPPPTADANAQLGLSSLDVLEFQAALGAAVTDPNAMATLLALRRAAVGWKALVGTKEPLDFKSDPGTLKDPKTAHCPTDCSGTITLCPGSKGVNCFGKDLPGNVVYATVGRMVGFSELSLQLGSQFAQLASTKTWDPPEDTAMISWGFNLPAAITRGTFCAELQKAKSELQTHPCHDCSEVLPISPVDPK